jgi:hypothetical protein
MQHSAHDHTDLSTDVHSLSADTTRMRRPSISSSRGSSSAMSYRDSNDVSPPGLSRARSLGAHISTVSGPSKNPGTPPTRPGHTSHSAPQKARSTRISSGNRFYADIIAKQQKEHMIVRRQKALESVPHAIPRRVPGSTRAPFASGFTPSTSSNTITRAASSEFASSFCQLALSRTPS